MPEETLEVLLVSAKGLHDTDILYTEEEQHLFVMFTDYSETHSNHLWFLDSGCSHHMTGGRESFTNLDEHFSLEVTLGNKKKLSVKGRETFAPVARFETIRLVIAVAAQRGWKLHQLDVKTAFLNGDLNEDIYVSQPEGFEVLGHEDKIDGYFIQHGYSRSQKEPTLYVKKKGCDILYVCLYVDDIVYTSSSETLLKEFKEGMEQEFEMSDMGLLKLFLGLEIKQTASGVFLSQEKYARNLVTKFGVAGCKSEATPMNTNEKFSSEDKAEKVDETLFRSLHPSVIHLGAAKRIVKYVTGTIGYGIWYEKGIPIQLTGYTDSDWASSIDDRKSVSASVFFLGSGAVTWSSKKQHTVALSSTEAEYIAASAATSQAIWLRRLLEDLDLKPKMPTKIFCDNQSTINLSKNPVMHGRSKHIEIKHHYVREMVTEQQIVLEFCGTNMQVADVLTKSLAREKFIQNRGLLGVEDFEVRGDEESFKNPYATWLNYDQESKGSNPQWKETFLFDVSSRDSTDLKIKIMDSDGGMGADDFVASRWMLCFEMEMFHQSHNIMKDDAYCGEIRIGLNFTAQLHGDEEKGESSPSPADEGTNDEGVVWASKQERENNPSEPKRRKAHKSRIRRSLGNFRIVLSDLTDRQKDVIAKTLVKSSRLEERRMILTIVVMLVSVLALAYAFVVVYLQDDPQHDPPPPPEDVFYKHDKGRTSFSILSIVKYSPTSCGHSGPISGLSPLLWLKYFLLLMDPCVTRSKYYILTLDPKGILSSCHHIHLDPVTYHICKTRSKYYILSLDPKGNLSSCHRIHPDPVTYHMCKYGDMVFHVLVGCCLSP
ncbi:hypothetical protein E3N88_43182 [Mikania micrantha]|uniref:C2 domain-containing protein n=1 Tax=Mikania micrantha TaxID=192012 RepID=A0A5N6LFK5_9ASTR|nr:hypothetical protein E3N88_43182 [Mikania micrantha]